MVETGWSHEWFKRSYLISSKCCTNLLQLCSVSCRKPIMILSRKKTVVVHIFLFRLWSWCWLSFVNESLWCIYNLWLSGHFVKQECVLQNKYTSQALAALLLYLDLLTCPQWLVAHWSSQSFECLLARDYKAPMPARNVSGRDTRMYKTEQIGSTELWSVQRAWLYIWMYTNSVLLFLTDFSMILREEGFQTGRCGIEQLQYEDSCDIGQCRLVANYQVLCVRLEGCSSWSLVPVWHRASLVIVCIKP